MNRSRKIILAITGASGSIYAQKLLDRLIKLKTRPEEIAVILSDNAREIQKYETGKKIIFKKPVKEYNNNHFMRLLHQVLHLMIL